MRKKVDDGKALELLNRVVRRDAALAYAARVVEGRDKGMNVSDLMRSNVLPDSFRPGDLSRLEKYANQRNGQADVGSRHADGGFRVVND